MRDSLLHALYQCGQPQLLMGVEQLSLLELKSFLEQFEKYGCVLANKQKELLVDPRKHCPAESVPDCHCEHSGNLEDSLYGEALIRQGKVGCLILAGGQGTRLGIDEPKGTVSLLDGKSLFQLFCERTQEVSSWAEQKPPLCIMTSAFNHQRTVDFFNAHRFFGLESTQISFITQGMLPLLDDCGDWLLESPGKIAEGPDGNGHALHLFFKTGVWEKWREQGIEYLNVIFVDNALADPFDAEFVGLTARKGVDAALKAVKRRSQEENMGALVMREGRLQVVEYSEISRNAPPLYFSSTGMFCIAMECIARLIQVEFPLHFARKTARVLTATSAGYAQERRSVWKCERFLFDLLDHVQSSVAFVCPREKIYAPLKNATGENSFETVRQALFFKAGLPLL